MAFKLLRIKPVYSSGLRRILLQDVLFEKTPVCCQGVNLKVFNCDKRLFSISVNRLGEKPVILSASDIIKDEPSGVLSSVSDITGDPSFMDLGLAQSWWPSDLIEGWFESFHVWSGCPWWATIALGTFALRLILLQPFISSRKTTIRYTNHAGRINELRTKLIEASGSKNFADQYTARMKYRKFVKDNKVETWRLMIFAGLQPVLFVSCMRALTAMTGVPVPSLAASSLLWINSLVEADPYRLLPFLSGVVIGANIYLSIKLNTAAMTSNFFVKRAGYIAMLPIVCMPLIFGNWSGALGIYLFTNSCFTLAVSLALSNSWVKKAVNLPVPVPPKSSNSNPIQGYFRELMTTSTERAHKKMEINQIKKMLKTEKKARKKELRKGPPVLYEIGSEAKLKEPKVPDFQREWRPPRPNIYDCS